MTEAYPLQWPVGRPRTKYPRSAAFDRQRSIDKSRRELFHELELLGAANPVLSTNLRLRLDGFPLSKQRQPDDQGVAVYFTYKKRQVCFACDRWDRIQDNIRAVCLTINAIRGIGRWGTGEMVDAAFTGFEALPPPSEGAVGRPWHIVLGVDAGASRLECESRYREKAKAAGEGSPELYDLNAAIAQARLHFEG